MSTNKDQIVRPVELLRGIRELAFFLRVSPSNILRFEKEGAPIFRTAGNQLRAEKSELWQWWKNKIRA